MFFSTRGTSTGAPVCFVFLVYEIGLMIIPFFLDLITLTPDKKILWLKINHWLSKIWFKVKHWNFQHVSHVKHELLMTHIQYMIWYHSENLPLLRFDWWCVLLIFRNDLIMYSFSAQIVSLLAKYFKRRRENKMEVTSR